MIPKAYRTPVVRAARIAFFLQMHGSLPHRPHVICLSVYLGRYILIQKKLDAHLFMRVGCGSTIYIGFGMLSNSLIHFLASKSWYSCVCVVLYFWFSWGMPISFKCLLKPFLCIGFLSHASQYLT
jgi:hypothetical protein